MHPGTESCSSGDTLGVLDSPGTIQRHPDTSAAVSRAGSRARPRTAHGGGRIALKNIGRTVDRHGSRLIARPGGTSRSTAPRIWDDYGPA